MSKFVLCIRLFCNVGVLMSIVRSLEVYGCNASIVPEGKSLSLRVHGGTGTYLRRANSETSWICGASLFDSDVCGLSIGGSVDGGGKIISMTCNDISVKNGELAGGSVDITLGKDCVPNLETIFLHGRSRFTAHKENLVHAQVRADAGDDLTISDEKGTEYKSILDAPDGATITIATSGNANDIPDAIVAVVAVVTAFCFVRWLLK